MIDNRFLLADFTGRQNQPTLLIVWHPLSTTTDTTKASEYKLSST